MCDFFLTLYLRHNRGNWLAIEIRMLLVEPFALKHWIVAGIGLDNTDGSTEIMSFHSALEVLYPEIEVVSPRMGYT